MAALKFFIGKDEDEEEENGDSDSDSEVMNSVLYTVLILRMK